MNKSCKALLALTLVGASALTIGCSENEGERQMVSDCAITFAPQVVSDWNTTRSGGQCVSTQPLKGADGFCLRTVVTPGIGGDRQQGVTRGAKYTNTTFGNLETFHVSGYRYNPEAGETVADVLSPNFFDNAEVGYEYSWKASGEYYYPLSQERTDFFAWFVPSGTSGVSVSSTKAGGLKLEYAQPTGISNISKQPDLLTAVTTAYEFDEDLTATVPLSFVHQLTEVQFVVDDALSPGTITDIAFLNICTNGTLDVGSGEWNTSNITTESVYEVNFRTFNGLVRRENATILSGLMMIPQKFNMVNQKIRIHMTVHGEQYELFADLGSPTNVGEWTAGTTVTYTISSSTLKQSLYETFSYNNVEFKMVFVEHGEIEGTTYGVVDHDYYIGETLVTNELWNAVMGSKPTNQTNNGDNYPVAGVSFNEIVAEDGILDRLNTALANVIGTRRFQLPDSYEWEYAARGGKDNPYAAENQYPGYGMPGITSVDDVAWYDANSNNTAHPVKQKAPNFLGLYDMAGNLREWTTTVCQVEPLLYYARGGGFFQDASCMLVTFAGSNYPYQTENHNGLRLILK